MIRWMVRWIVQWIIQTPRLLNRGPAYMKCDLKAEEIEMLQCDGDKIVIKSDGCKKIIDEVNMK